MRLPTHIVHPITPSCSHYGPPPPREKHHGPYAEAEAKRSRSFAGFEVWTGTPGAPGKPTNIKIQGKH